MLEAMNTLQDMLISGMLLYEAIFLQHLLQNYFKKLTTVICSAMKLMVAFSEFCYTYTFI